MPPTSPPAATAGGPSLRAGPPAAERPRAAGRGRAGRRRTLDRLSRRLVALGGVAVIASILAILAVIVVEVVPLFLPPGLQPAGAVALTLEGTLLALDVDEHRQVVAAVTASGLAVASARTGRLLATALLPQARAAGSRPVVTAASAPGRGPFALGLSDGRAVPATVTFSVAYRPEGPVVTPTVAVGPPLVLDPAGRPLRHLAYAVTRDGPVAAAVVGPRTVVVASVRERRALVGPAGREVVRRTFPAPVRGEVTALAADGRGDAIYLGSSAGELVAVRPGAAGAPLARAAAGPAPITVLGLLLGDRTLVAGDVDGRVTSWQLLPSDEGGVRLARIHAFDGHDEPVAAFAPSRRDKGFATADRGGAIHLHYGTTGRTLARVRGAPAHTLAYAPKADALLAVDAAGRLATWSVRNPHPEVTLRSLFGRVWYEGYPAPTYVWQSTGATDDFEAKVSLTPLVYGTLKGTVYALLFAVPLALLGALYASQFMHPALRGIVKPAVEIMAGLPSVVLGFLAGLWLAPRVERVVPGILLVPPVVALLVLGACVARRRLPPDLRRRVRPGTEIAVLLPVVAAGVWLALRLGAVAEGWLLGGDYRAWLLSVLGLTYDQRNSLVVGLAMGFAVVPIIFTIAEDALSNVPGHLTAGALALGATRWQTATRVVLPVASPGMFSAVMIGFGRAVGETMIVLMATGNTPVMNWSLFSGFRALSANIAVELPEAPHGGTLYRVLFLAALVLFAMTFVVNTAAEVVRMRLRGRYQAL